MANTCPELSDLDLAEAYSLAIAAEEEGYNFYNKIIEKTESVRAKNELAYLRDEEKKHKEIFEKLLQDSGQEFVKNEESDLSCWVEAEIVGPMKEALEKNLPETSHEALKVGVILEDKSIDMFERMKGIAKDKESVKAIKNVLKEEKKHKKRLNIIMAY
jgi:rubrerythrin